MKQSVLNFLRAFLPFSVLLFFGQYFIVKELAQTYVFFYNTWSIYIFHASATFIVFLALLAVHETSPDRTGFAFLAGSVLKMMAAVLFLVPLIRSEMDSKLPDLAAFFVPYFLFLAFETAFALKLINRK